MTARSDKPTIETAEERAERRLAEVTRERDEALAELAELICKAQDMDQEIGRLRAFVDALPRCIGRHIGGSGAHMRFSNNCERPATWWSSESCLWEWACDEHVDRIRPESMRDETWWADALRALEKIRDMVATAQELAQGFTPDLVAELLDEVERLELPSGGRRYWLKRGGRWRLRDRVVEEERS